MSEEPTTTDAPPASDEVAEETAEQQQERGVDPWAVVGTVVLIILVIVILLLLRNCGESGTAGSVGGTKEIVAVPRYEPVDGVVSVWVSNQTTINKVLGAAGIRSDKVLSLGAGRYVVSVRPGTERAAIDELKSRYGVFDAGLVYDKDNPSRQ